MLDQPCGNVDPNLFYQKRSFGILLFGIGWLQLRWKVEIGVNGILNIKYV